MTGVQTNVKRYITKMLNLNQDSDLNDHTILIQPQENYNNIDIDDSVLTVWYVTD